MNESKYTLIPASSIIVPKERQRDDYPEVHIRELAKSIGLDCLIHAPTVTDGLELIAGFCRREAVLLLNKEYEYGGERIQAGYIPVIIASGKSESELTRIELEENLRRRNLSPVQEARAIAKLHRMLSEQAGDAGWSNKQTVAELHKMEGKPVDSPTNFGSLRLGEDLLIDQFADDPDVQRAKTRAEALKTVKKKLDAQFSQGLGELTTITNEDFKLYEGSCYDLFPTFQEETFAGIIADPPYGVDADSFGEQAYTGGLAGGHAYADTLDAALAVAGVIFREGFRVCKEGAHLYMFCDIRLWPELSICATKEGWQCYATPIIWHKPNAGHAPQPGFFTRRYETILFARKGTRKLVTSAADVMSFPSVGQGKMYAAEKPVELLTYLCKLSFLPGETILDPTCGSGPIFAAGKAAGLRVVGMEILPEAINLSKKRISEL